MYLWQEDGHEWEKGSRINLQDNCVGNGVKTRFKVNNDWDFQTLNNWK